MKRVNMSQIIFLYIQIGQFLNAISYWSKAHHQAEFRTPMSYRIDACIPIINMTLYWLPELFSGAIRKAVIS